MELIHCKGLMHYFMFFASIIMVYVIDKKLAILEKRLRYK